MLKKSNYQLGDSDNAEFRLELLNELTVPKFIQAMDSVPKSNVRLLNLGCGSGHLEAFLSDIFVDSEFVGIDVSPNRIDEAVKRTSNLVGTNSYKFIEGDVRTFDNEKIEPFDIIVIRFLLTHLVDPIAVMERYLPLLKQGGFICIEEAASLNTEYYTNLNDEAGYWMFTKEMSRAQTLLQKSSFEVGFHLLERLTEKPFKLIRSELQQAILQTPRAKSIYRLGLQDASPALLDLIGREKVNQMSHDLSNFEENEKAFGLHLRTMILIAQSCTLELNPGTRI